METWKVTLQSNKENRYVRLFQLWSDIQISASYVKNKVRNLETVPGL